MKKSGSERYYLVLYLSVWSVLYFALGYFSLLIDDPASRVALVWFPAGVAVSAFLSSQRKHWLLIYIVLFLTRTLLDVAVRHSIGTSFAISLVSLTCDLSVAWSVVRFAGHADDLRKAVVWLIAVCVFSAVAALAGTSWLSMQNGISIAHSISIWWAANVVGNIMVTTVLTGLLRGGGPSLKLRWRSALAGALLTAVSTVLIFTLPPFREDEVGLIYTLACLPVLITVIIPVISGNRAGALVYTLFCSIAIYFSWQQIGPFFIKGLRHGEPLLVAQCYLAGTALLMIFIRIQTDSVQKGQAAARHAVGETAYCLDTTTGVINWDPMTPPGMEKIISAVGSREALFALVSPSVKADIASRWQSALTANNIDEEYRFPLPLADGEELAITERNLVCLPGPHGTVLIGYWSLSQPLITLKTG
ncbi:hypothetical protein NG99_20065 [Erwinia typographi]|uniref:MASE1 domain-containing protein n=1 Tax=Erwinia typographi TaxID=371042 RepID=A0A0A3YUE9_9GAMM|nr:MASE1 domain-containing protein [Erwinia typographi]KGT89129.1 hypothetical protein NG99_20065 [Erwinia typographi]